MTKYTTTWAGSSRDRFSRRRVSASTSLTTSRGTTRVSTPILIRSVSRPPAIWSVSSTTPKITFSGKQSGIRRFSTEPARVTQWKCVYTFPEIN